ncbi:hypothetical protein CALCODRAFT_169166 [Calocera cornea HHB12733]|uniref:Uncharacterized protein n=1 Tax=Calocera cornea HHB12733 TaxID=1353952 RepID=A0A165CGZ7_9BASI|nr:hypothetical protein CALCODRAFT_169166 [Calocera cornea HHB12733]
MRIQSHTHTRPLRPGHKSRAPQSAAPPSFASLWSLFPVSFVHRTDTGRRPVSTALPPGTQTQQRSTMTICARHLTVFVVSLSLRRAAVSHQLCEASFARNPYSHGRPHPPYSAPRAPGFWSQAPPGRPSAQTPTMGCTGAQARPTTRKTLPAGARGCGEQEVTSACARVHEFARRQIEALKPGPPRVESSGNARPYCQTSARDRPATLGHRLARYVKPASLAVSSVSVYQLLSVHLVVAIGGQLCPLALRATAPGVLSRTSVAACAISGTYQSIDAAFLPLCVRFP